MDTEQNPSEEETLSSNDLFTADSQAVVQEAPDYETGIKLLNDYYSVNEYEDKQAATKTLQSAASSLAQKFEIPDSFTEEETKSSIAPFPLEEIKIEDPFERINEWEIKNSEALFKAAEEDPQTKALLPKLINSIHRTAVSERRKLNGKEPLEEYEAKLAENGEEGLLHQLGRRVLGGFAGGPIGLVDSEIEDSLTRPVQGESYPRKIAAEVAGGAGFVAGIGATALVSPALAAGYVVANAVSAVKRKFTQAEEETGNTPQAILAGTVESASQLAQGARGFRAVSALEDRAAKGLSKYVTKEGLTEGAKIGAIGAAGSTLSAQVGRGEIDPRDLSTILNGASEVAKASAEGALVGAAVGGIAEAGRKVYGDYTKPPPPKFQKQTKIPDEAAPGGERTALHDEAFAVTKDVAEKVETLKETVDPEGERIPVYVNPAGKLVAKSPYLKEDLTLSPTPVSSNPNHEVEIKTQPVTEVSENLVKANKVKAGDRGEPVYTEPEVDASQDAKVIESYRQILASGSVANPAVRQKLQEQVAAFDRRQGKSAGAAHIEELTKERTRAKQRRLNPLVSERIRNDLGGTEGPGIDRYLPQSSLELEALIKRSVGENFQEALAEFLSLPVERISEEDAIFGAVLFDHLNTAEINARAAGDFTLADNIKHYADEVQYKDSLIGTKGGRILEAMKRGKGTLSPVERRVYREVLKEADAEVALENKVTVEELGKVDENLEKVTEQLQELNSKEDPDVLKLDEDITSTQQLLGELDKQAQERLEKANAPDEAYIQKNEALLEELKIEQERQAEEIDKAIEANEQEVKALEESHKEAVKKANEELKERVRQLETEIERLEKTGQEKAEKAQAKEIADAEEAIKVEEGNIAKGAKGKPEKLAKAKENLEKAKSSKPKLEDGLTSDQRKALKKYQRDLETTKARPTPTLENTVPAAEIKKLERLKNTGAKAKEKRAKVVDPEQEKRVKQLEDFIRERKNNIAARTAESVESAGNKSTRAKLNSALKEKKAARDTKQSKFTASQKEDLKRLTAQKDKLTEVKKARKSKARQKFEEALPKETLERLRALHQGLDLVKNDITKRAWIETEIAKIEHDAAKTYAGKLRTLGSLVRTYYYANILFRASTQAVNIGFNLSKVGLNALAYTATGFGDGRSVVDGVNYLKVFGQEARRTGFAEAARVFKEGKDQIKTQVQSRSFKEGEDLSILPGDPRFTGLYVKEGHSVGYPDPVQSLQEGFKTLAGNSEGGKKLAEKVGWLGYSLRALSAADAVFTRAGYEAEAHLKATVEGRRKGLQGEALRSHIANELFNSEKDWAAALQEAKNNQKVLDSLGFDKLGFKTSENDLLSSAWSILDGKRRADLRAEAAYAAGLSWLSSDVTPRGAAGYILDQITQVVNKPWKLPNGKVIENPGSIIVPFLRTTLKVANLTIDATPVGFAKAASGKYVFSEPENVVRAQLGTAVVGSLIGGSIYALLRSQRDDPNPYFDIIGPVPLGPGKEGDRAAFFAAGAKPWSIKVGDTYFPFTWTPLVGPLGAVALLNSKVKDGSIDEREGMDVAGTLMWGSFKAFADLPVINTMTGVLEALATGSDRKDSLKNLGASMTRGFIPGITIIEELNRAYDTPIATKNSFMAKVLKGTPLASLAGRPQLNLWGEPVDRQWYEKIPIAGSMAGRFISMESSDEDFLWLVNNGYHVSGIETKVKLGSKSPDFDEVKELRTKNLGAIYDDVLTEAENYELQLQLGPKLKEIVSGYRKTYGNSFSQEVQDQMLKEMQDIKRDLKYELFIKGAYGNSPK